MQIRIEYFIKSAVFMLMVMAFFNIDIRNGNAQGIPTIIRDAEIEETLFTMTAPVFQAAGIGRNDVRLILVEDPGLNAFVAGGMNIFLYTGVILAADNPDELIGVLAHETGHIAGAHLIRTHQVMERASFQALLATIMGAAAAAGGAGDAAGAIFSGGSAMAQQGFLAHSRTQEAAADQAAVRYLRDAGYDARGLLTFLEKLRQQDNLPGSHRYEYLRTHPLTSNRISFLRNSVENASNDSRASHTSQAMFERMQAKLNGFIYPDMALRYPNDSVSNQYARAIAYYRKNQIERALDMLDTLIGQEPQNAYFHELKGQILFENGRSAEAVTQYQRAVELAPQSDLIRSYYGQAILAAAAQDADYERAIEQFERALRTENRSPRLHRMLATAYGRIGNDGAARLHLAEEAVLQRDKRAATRQVGLAEQALEPGDRKYLRLQDLKSYLDTLD